MGTPNSVIQPLQKILNFAARLVLLASRHHHLTTLLEKLHWLPTECIKCKVACMCFSAISGSGPAYLSQLLHVYTPSCTLRSPSDAFMLKIQQYKRKTHGFRTFSCFGPHIWPNSLPHCSTLSSFKAKLKTFLTVFPLQLISIPNFCYSHCACVCVRACVRACMHTQACMCLFFHIILYVNCFGIVCIEYCI